MTTPNRAHGTRPSTYTLTHAQHVDPFSGPDVAALTRDPYVCFADSGEGGGEPGDEGTADTPTYTQAQYEKAIQQRLAKEQRKHERVLAELREKASAADELEALRAQVAEMQEQAELAGKTAAEQAELKRAKEREAYDRKLQEAQATIAERDKALQDQVARYRGERLSRSITDALSASKVRPDALTDATQLAAVQLTDVQHHDDGSITASYGDAIDAPISEAIAEWAKSKPAFLPAPPPGSGTRNTPGVNGSKPLHELPLDELLRMSRRN